MRSRERELLQALQEIVAACSGEAIDEVERTHEGFSSSDAHAYTVGKVQAIAQNAIREAARAERYEAAEMPCSVDAIDAAEWRRTGDAE